MRITVEFNPYHTQEHKDIINCSDSEGIDNWIGWALEINNDLKTFEYTDTMKNEVIYIVKAKDIFDADIMLYTELGIRAQRLSHIGCRIINDVDVD